MAILLAVDPGLLHPAAALFVNDELVKASRVKVPRGITTRTPMLERVRAISLAITDYVGVIPDTVVCEVPQIYVREKSKGDPNNLIPLAVMCGVLAGLYVNARVIGPRPREWTGNVPKSEDGDPWKSPRGLRIWSRLTPAERARVVPSHDSIDSVGLGLFALGRFDRRRVYAHE